MEIFVEFTALLGLLRLFFGVDFGGGPWDAPMEAPPKSSCPVVDWESNPSGDKGLSPTEGVLPSRGISNCGCCGDRDCCGNCCSCGDSCCCWNGCCCGDS